MSGLNAKKINNGIITTTALIVPSWKKEEEMRDVKIEAGSFEVGNSNSILMKAAWLKLRVNLDKDPCWTSYKIVTKKLYDKYTVLDCANMVAALLLNVRKTCNNMTCEPRIRNLIIYKIRRKVALQTVCTYRAMLYEGASLLALLHPLHLQAKKCKVLYVDKLNGKLNYCLRWVIFALGNSRDSFFEMEGGNKLGFRLCMVDIRSDKSAIECCFELKTIRHETGEFLIVSLPSPANLSECFGWKQMLSYHGLRHGNTNDWDE